LVNHINEGVADRISKTGAATHTPLPQWVISGLAIERLDRLLSALIPTGDKTGRYWFVSEVPQADIALWFMTMV
jgi:hypothetical protein